MPWTPTPARRPDSSRTRDVLAVALLAPLLALGVTAATAGESSSGDAAPQTPQGEARPGASAATEPAPNADPPTPGPVVTPEPVPAPTAQEAPAQEAPAQEAPTQEAPAQELTPVEEPAAQQQAAPTGDPAPEAPEPPAAPTVVQAGDGELVTVAGSTPPSGAGPTTTYRVRVEGGLGVDPDQFARDVDATLADPRSWGSGGRRSFARTDGSSYDVEVVLSSPTLTDALCRPLRTNGRLSCASGNTAVLNSMRWLTGADVYAGDLAGYRQYLVNHEVGHTLGSGHVGCPGAGEPAPVMMQQTKGIGACVRNSWPYP